MQIVLVHDSVVAADAADAQDVLIQAEAVAQALQHLGHTCSRYSCNLNLEEALAVLRKREAGLVFNLVESLAGKGRLIHVLPTCLEAEGIPFTGSGSVSLLLSSNKLLAKKKLHQAGIATPPWIELDEDGAPRAGKKLKGSWIIKSVWEHASIGMDGASVQSPGSMVALQQLLQEYSHKQGGPFFAENYIVGREFNVSLLADGNGGLEALPVAEIVFDNFPEDLPKIVDYAAKWEESSFAYRHTLRKFPGKEDAALLAQLQALAVQCWRALELRGYARVDFRVDRHGRPWVLEVNANPCLAPDAGFAAALNQAGVAFHEAVARVVKAALAEGR